MQIGILVHTKSVSTDDFQSLINILNVLVLAVSQLKKLYKRIHG